MTIVRPAPNYRTTDEAAALIGLADGASVRQAYRRGRIEGEIIDGRLWIPLREIGRYMRDAQVGRPLGSITGVSNNLRGERETEYQREYRRAYRERERKGLPGALSAAKKRRSTKRSPSKHR